MSSLSICAPMRTFRPLSRRLAELSRPCRRNLCDTSSPRPALVLRLTHDNHHSPQSSTDTARIWQVSKPTYLIQYRAFSGSTSFKTKNILNPRKDDDGKDMLVEISARAANRLHAIAEKDANPNLCLRVTVESGGCHGFQYLMSLTSLESVSQEEDVLFESEDGKNAKVVLDESSLELLKGSTIDYTMELIGSQFKVTGIPGAKSSCGCGTSFDIQT